MTTTKQTWMLIIVIALIVGALLWLQFDIAGSEAQEVSVEKSYVGVGGKVVIEIANRTDEILDNIYLVLRPFKKDGEVLPTSLNERVLIQGPRIHGYKDQLGDIEYMGLQQTPHGESVLTISIMPGKNVKTYFILQPKFIHKYGAPESYHIEVFRIGNHEPLAAWIGDYEPLAAQIGDHEPLSAQIGGRLTDRLPEPVLLLAFTPLLLVLLLLMPGLRRCLPVFPETGLKRPRPWFFQTDKFIAVMLVVLTTSSFLHINGPFPAGRDPDSFDYLSISEVFDVDMESCIGKWDKGYDRREFLHQVPDRSWGYPLFLSIVAKIVGLEEIGCQEYMRIVQSLQIFMLVLSCLIAAALLYRVWTPSNFPYIRSALIYSVLLLHSYNFYPVNSMLTEVMSRLLFVVCLAGSFGLLFSGSSLRRHGWTVLAVISAALATIVRPEHILIEPVIVAGFVLMLLLRHRAWAVFRTFVLASVASILVVSSVSYVKFGTLQHSTATGFRLLNVIHRLEIGELHLDKIPPGVQLNEEQTRFFNEVIIPAAKTEWGKSNPWIAVPGFLQNQTPLEMSKIMREFTVGVLFQNIELWVASTWHRFKLLAVDPNQTRPGTTDSLQKKFNLFGFSKKNSMWFGAILAWILGRYLLSKKGRLPTRGSIEFAIVIMVSMYFYMFLSAAVEVGAIRTRYFSSGFIPLLGMLIALDAAELIMNTCARCAVQLYHRAWTRFA